MRVDGKYRQDGIKTMADLEGRCILDEMSGCLVWAGPSRKGAGIVWLPQAGQAVSLTFAYGALAGKKLKPGQRWYAACGNFLCISHRAIGTASDSMKASRKTLAPEHRAKITKAMRERGGKYSPELAAELRAGTEPCSEAASRHGLHPSTVQKVRSGLMWADQVVGASVFNWRPAA